MLLSKLTVSSTTQADLSEIVLNTVDVFSSDALDVTLTKATTGTASGSYIPNSVIYDPLNDIIAGIEIIVIFRPFLILNLGWAF